MRTLPRLFCSAVPYLVHTGAARTAHCAEPAQRAARATHRCDRVRSSRSARSNYGGGRRSSGVAGLRHGSRDVRSPRGYCVDRVGSVLLQAVHIVNT